MRGINFPLVLLVVLCVFAVFLLQDRERTTTHSSYHDNGCLSGTYQLDSQNRLHGKSYCYHEDGRLKVVTEYSHGDWVEHTTYNAAGEVEEHRVAY